MAAWFSERDVLFTYDPCNNYPPSDAMEKHKLAEKESLAWCERALDKIRYSDEVSSWSEYAFVYWIGMKVGEAHYIKVGFATNPKSRMSGMQTSSPVKLEMLHWVKTEDASEEHRLREKLCRTNGCSPAMGEWVSVTPEVYSRIRRRKKLSCYIADADPPRAPKGVRQKSHTKNIRANGKKGRTRVTSLYTSNKHKKTIGQRKPMKTKGKIGTACPVRTGDL